MKLSKDSTPTHRRPKPVDAANQGEQKWIATSTGRQVFGTTVSWPKFQLDEPDLKDFIRYSLT